MLILMWQRCPICAKFCTKDFPHMNLPDATFVFGGGGKCNVFSRPQPARPSATKSPNRKTNRKIVTKKTQIEKEQLTSNKIKTSSKYKTTKIKNTYQTQNMQTSNNNPTTQKNEDTPKTIIHQQNKTEINTQPKNTPKHPKRNSTPFIRIIIKLYVTTTCF